MRDTTVFVRVRKDQSLQPGDEVLTPAGTGTVLVIREAAPEDERPESICVLLDAKRNRGGYRGTDYPAVDVRRLVN